MAQDKFIVYTAHYTPLVLICLESTIVPWVSITVEDSRAVSC